MSRNVTLFNLGNCPCWPCWMMDGPSRHCKSNVQKFFFYLQLISKICKSLPKSHLIMNMNSIYDIFMIILTLCTNHDTYLLWMYGGWSINRSWWWAHTAVNSEEIEQICLLFVKNCENGYNGKYKRTKVWTYTNRDTLS